MEKRWSPKKVTQYHYFVPTRKLRVVTQNLIVSLLVLSSDTSKHKICSDTYTRLNNEHQSINF